MENVITSIVRPGMSHGAALAAIQDTGARFLGSGYSTYAYEFRVRLAKHDPTPVMRNMDPAMAYAPIKIEVIDEARCLRVSTNEKGIRLTMEAAMMHPDDPFAPKVYSIVELKDGFACEMEVLSRADDYEDAYDDGLLWDYGAGICGKHLPRPYLFEVSPFMAYIERKRPTIGAEYDFHDANVMYRERNGERHPVILDPIVALYK